MCGCEHRVSLPQRPGVWRDRQCRDPKTHLHSRQPRKVQAPCTRAPHSLRRRRRDVSATSASCSPAAPTLVPPSRSSLRVPVPLVVLAVSASKVDRAHAETAQHAGTAVLAAAQPRERTYGGRLGVSSALSARLSELDPLGETRTRLPRGGNKISSLLNVFAQVNPAC